MPDTVQIERLTLGPEDGSGGYGPPTRVVVSTVIGQITPVRSVTNIERERSGQIAQDGTETLSVPLDADIQGTDTVVVVSGRFGTAQRYAVVEVVPLGSYDVQRMVTVTKFASDAGPDVPVDLAGGA